MRRASGTPGLEGRLCGGPLSPGRIPVRGGVGGGSGDISANSAGFTAAPIFQNPCFDYAHFHAQGIACCLIFAFGCSRGRSRWDKKAVHQLDGAACNGALHVRTGRRLGVRCMKLLQRRFVKPPDSQDNRHHTRIMGVTTAAGISRQNLCTSTSTVRTPRPPLQIIQT